MRPSIVVAPWRGVVGCCSCVLLGGDAWPMLGPAGTDRVSCSAVGRHASTRPSAARHGRPPGQPNLTAPARRFVWNSVHLLKFHVRAEDRKITQVTVKTMINDRGVSGLPICSRRVGGVFSTGWRSPASASGGRFHRVLFGTASDPRSDSRIGHRSSGRRGGTSPSRRSSPLRAQ